MINPREQVLRPFIEQADFLRDRVHSGIEQNRKGWFTLTVKDADGNPLPGAAISLTQKTHEFRFGANCFMLDEMETPEKNAEYKRLFADCFNLATLPFYWDDLEPEEGRPRFAKDSPKVYRRPAPDLCLEFCEQNGIEPKAHCLDYDIYTPLWLKNEPLPAVRHALYKRFSLLAERYASRIPTWEVTNETLYPYNIRFKSNTVHYPQPDSVAWSFRTADRLFPLNRLVINESTKHIWAVFNGNRSEYYMQIERLLEQGCRISSVGLQFHMFHRAEEEQEKTGIFYSPEQICRVLDRYADFHLPIQITELTIPAYSRTEADEDIQAEIIRNLYSLWFSHPAMEAVIYWNLVDGYAAHAPQGDMTSGENYYHGGLVRFDLTPKKAYYTVRDLFRKTWRTDIETGTGEGGRANVKAFYGQYDLTVRAGDRSVTRSVDLSKAGSRSLTVTV